MINNPADSPSNATTLIARAIWAAMQTQTANNAKNFITKMVKDETADALYSGTSIAEFAVGVNEEFWIIILAWSPLILSLIK